MGKLQGKGVEDEISHDQGRCVVTSANLLTSLFSLDHRLRGEKNLAYALIDVSSVHNGMDHPVLRSLGAGVVCGASLSAMTQPMLYGPLDLQSETASSLIDLDREAAAVHFLWSTSASQALAQHLQDLTHGIDEDGNTLFVRYFDRTIWPWYWSALSERQRGLVLGPVTVWATAESDSELTAVRAPQGPRALDAPGRRRYTREQIRRMTLATLPQALWAALEDEFPERAVDEKEVLTTLRRIVDRASGLGLVKWSDFYRFAHLGLGLHEQLDMHPDVASELAHVKSRTRTLGEALTAVDVSVWDELQRAGNPEAVP
jgi:hypothetical protein